MAPQSEARLIDAANAGDEAAFRVLSQPHLRTLRAYCVRIMGSAEDAEDVVQETLLRAWTRLDGFRGQASFKAWLYAIATNTGLNALAARKRQDERHSEGEAAEMVPSPAAAYEIREHVELAFLAAIDMLPPRQRAVVILRDGLGWSASETAALLDTSTASVTSALQRARQTLAKRAGDDGPPAAVDDLGKALLGRYLGAWEKEDIQALVRLLRTDAARTSLLRGLRPRGGGWLRKEEPAEGGGEPRYALFPAFASRD